MKNEIKLFTLVPLLLFTIFANAQHEHDEMAYRAYLTTNKSLWKQLVANRQEAYEQDKTSKNLYNLVLAQHGLLNSTLVDQDEELFDDHFKKTKRNLEELIEAGYQPGNCKALLSSIYGWEMGYSPWKSMFLGPKSSSAIEKATTIASTSPIVWQVHGSSKLFTPAAFGGSLTEAISSYEKSVELYESDLESIKSNWRYLDALAWLGQAYANNGQTESAQKVYKKALETEPEFGWVKHVLLPDLESN